MANEWTRATWVYRPVALSHTPLNIIGAFHSFLLANGWALTSWSGTAGDRYYVRTDHATSDVWHYTGNGPIQRCGIRIMHDTSVSPNRIRLMTFLENLTGDAAYRCTNSAHWIDIIYDNTQDNNFTIIGGEHGLYFEVGTGTLVNNVAHGAIATFLPIPEMNSTRDDARKWCTQGMCLDLFGMLKFTTDRNFRFVETEGSRRHHTGRLRPYIVRGTDRWQSNVVGDDRRVFIGPMDHFRSGFFTGSQFYERENLSTFLCTFGLFDGITDDRYRVSPMAADLYWNGSYQQPCANSASEAVLTGGSFYDFYVYDPRMLQQVKKFAVVASALVPWNNITEPVSGKVYRVANVTDNGRNSRIGIEWPTGVTTIPASPV